MSDSRFAAAAEQSGKPFRILYLTESGGSYGLLGKALQAARSLAVEVSRARRSPCPLSALTLAVKCGTSDATSGIAGNPTVGNAFDKTQISFFDDPVRCAQMCNRLADELEQRIKDGVSVVPEGTKRILITGTPLAVPNWKLHNIIETSGAAVVCEEMCTGTRYFENLVDESGETLDEQFMNLSRRYMKTNCACFTPNTGRIDDILRMVDEYQVDGVIDCSLMFCCLYDTEKRAVAEALKEKNIPVLSLETDYTDTDAEQLRTRIGAFVEMLSK